VRIEVTHAARAASATINADLKIMAFLPPPLTAFDPHAGTVHVIRFYEFDAGGLQSAAELVKRADLRVCPVLETLDRTAGLQIARKGARATNLEVRAPLSVGFRPFPSGRCPSFASFP
jgi:hypothetical protein